MLKKLINKYDPSLPIFAIVVLAFLLFSACSLNRGSSGEVTSSDQPVAVAETDSLSAPSRIIEEVYAETDDDSDYVAGVIQAFDQSKFEAAVADGKKVLLDFYASWCPTCRANEPIVDSAFDNYSDIVVFRVDYDNEAELKKEYSVSTQSTYLFLENGEEKDRYVGALSEDKLANLLVD